MRRTSGWREPYSLGGKVADAMFEGATAALRPEVLSSPGSRTTFGRYRTLTPQPDGAPGVSAARPVSGSAGPR